MCRKFFCDSCVANIMLTSGLPRRQLKCVSGDLGVGEKEEDAPRCRQGDQNSRGGQDARLRRTVSQTIRMGLQLSLVQVEYMTLLTSCTLSVRMPVIYLGRRSTSRGTIIRSWQTFLITRLSISTLGFCASSATTDNVALVDGVCIILSCSTRQSDHW